MTRRWQLALLALVVGCPAHPSHDQVEPTATPAAPAREHGPGSARVPAPLGALSPALTEVSGSGAIDGLALANDAGTCAPCHADVVTQWRTSAHAFSSFSNPIYRASVESFRAATSPETSRFCAGCHDIALLIDGAMTAQEVASDDPRAHAGVTCLTCHSIASARRDGNGSYTLRTDPVVMPREGDPASLKAHIERLTLPPLRSAELCGSCHRAFLGVETGHGHHLPGADDYGAWQSSTYAGNELDRIDFGVDSQGGPHGGEKSCAACHMGLEDAPEGDVAAREGRVASHRFTGGHSWLAAMRHDAPQLERVRANLRDAARVDVVAVRDGGGALVVPAEAAALAAGTSLDLEVVVTNERVGHRFPGGTLDMHDTWLEVVVEDAHGETIAAHGVRHTRDARVADAHVLHAVIVDDGGKPVLARRVEAFRTLAYDNTIGPRDSVVVPYRLEVPTSLAADALPLVATVRLLHRSREAQLAAVACRDPRRPAFEAITPLEACVAQPLTVIDTAVVLLGTEGPSYGELDLALAERLLRHGTGWQHVLGEDADKARPSLLRVVHDLAPTTRKARALVAAAAHQLAVVAARQGRIEEMNHWLARANPLAEDHPALAYVRGLALSSVWRHADAIPWLEQAVAGAASDPRGFTALAIAFGSVGRDHDALAAAHGGLALAPRHPDLLRVQSLALRHSRDVALARSARDAFTRFRVRDDTPRLRSLCSSQVAGCALERTPGHHHPLRPPAAARSPNRGALAGARARE